MADANPPTANIEARLAGIESNLSGVEKSVSSLSALVYWVAGIFAVICASCFGYLLVTETNTGKELSSLNAKVDSYQNEALVRTLREIKTDSSQSQEGKDVRDALQKITSETIQQELDKKPVSYSLYFELGMFAASNNNPKEAAGYFEKAVALNSLDFKSWSSLSAAYVEIADREPHNKSVYGQKAKEAADKALGLNPKYRKAQDNLAIALFMLGQKENAVEAAKKAIMLDQAVPSPYYNIACFYGTDAWDTNKSEDYLELAVQKGFDNPMQLQKDEGKCFNSIRKTPKFLRAKKEIIKRAHAPILP